MLRVLQQLVQAVSFLAQQVKAFQEAREVEFDWFKSHIEFATKKDLKEMEGRIMSAISEFASKQQAHNQRVETAVDGITGDLKVLTDLIEQLQNSPGDVTPEDQASLNQLETKADALATKLEALDNLTPPTPPV